MTRTALYTFLAAIGVFTGGGMRRAARADASDTPPAASVGKTKGRAGERESGRAGETAPPDSALTTHDSRLTTLESPPHPVTPSPLQPLTLGQVRIVSPAAREVLDIPAATVVVQSVLGSKVEIKINGAPVDPKLLGRTETVEETGMVTQYWYGVVLKEGENTLTAQATVNGQPGPLVNSIAFVRAAPTQMLIAPSAQHIPADGRSTVTITGRLLDKDGNRSNRDALITLTVSAGEFVGKDADEDLPGFQVQARQGQFTAVLASGFKSETVRVHATTTNLEAYTQVEFTTDLRPSLVTGVVDLRVGKSGPDLYRAFQSFMRPDAGNPTNIDAYSAVFATGRLAQWLFTGAFNSRHGLNQTASGAESLGRDTQYHDQTYPVLGDSSVSRAIAESRDNLYLRLERNRDYVMWGDYTTQEFASKSQQFTAVTRQLHAFKANYNFGSVQATTIYANNVQGFQRDTIAPDGTSGAYFLSHRPLVYGSENVYIEMEELQRPGTIIATSHPIRGTDYEIDYDRGTIVFHKPISRTDIAADGTPLVRRIVVTYQYETSGGGADIEGARVQAHFNSDWNHPSQLGLTAFRENQGLRRFSLYGSDLALPLGKGRGGLVAEYGHSENNSEMLGMVTGNAYRVQLDGTLWHNVQASANYRSADTGFANDATISFVPGQTRYGMQLSSVLGPTTRARIQYDHEDNKGIAPQPATAPEGLLDPGAAPIPGQRVDNSLQTISLGLEQRIRSADLAVDLVNRHRIDRIGFAPVGGPIIPGSLGGNSTQIQTRFAMPVTRSVTFQAQSDTTVSNEHDPIYSDRTLLALDWQARPDVDIRLSQQWFTAGQFTGQSITSLDTIVEKKWGDATASERFSIRGGSNGFNIQQALGLSDRWTIARGLKLSVGYEQINGSFFGRTAAGTQFPQPYAVGPGGTVALGITGGNSRSIGLEYLRTPDFKASARYETRTSSGGSNTVVTAGAAGKLSPSSTALVTYQQTGSSNQLLESIGASTILRLGLAYRDPKNDRFNGLLHYDFRKNPATVPDSILIGSGTGSTDHLFAIEGIYAPSWMWEFYGKYAFRNSTSFLASDFTNGSSITLSQLRATYRFRYRMDIAAEGRWLSQSEVNYGSVALLLEAGYYITANLRLSAGYNFGHVSDPDFSGSRSAGGFYLGITAKVNELFHGFGVQPTELPANVAAPKSATPQPTGFAGP